MSKLRAPSRATALFTAALMLASCASSSSSIKPRYVSEAQYSGHSCEMIASDLERVTREAAAIAGEQDSAHAADAVFMTVGLLVFWPALFGLAFTPDQEAELSRLLGEKEALERAANRKGCTQLESETPSYEILAPATEEAPEEQEAGIEIELLEQKQQSLN